MAESSQSILFPVDPCNKPACKSLIEGLGGCDKICDRYGYVIKAHTLFRCVEISPYSLYTKLNWTRKFIPKGSLYKRYNCGCKCTFDASIIDDVNDLTFFF